MLLCNYVLTPTLKTTLVLPSASFSVAISPALLASASVVIVAVILVIHRVPLLQISLPASGRRGRRGRRVILALASVEPKEVNEAALYLQLTHNTIIRTLYCDEHNAVALRVPLTTHLHTICSGLG
jgi:hypothetical protein